MAAADYANVVQQLYVSYFGRPADYYGLQNFEAQLNTMGAPTTVAGIAAAVQAGTNVALVKLVNSFNAAPESVALYGAGTTQIEISKFVADVYTNVLGRPADVAGANWWINEIVSGRLTKANAALAISAGALTNTTDQGKIDAATITAKVAVATDFTTSLDTIPEINAFSGDAAAAAARAMLATVTNTTTVATFHATVDATIAALGTAATAGQTFTLTEKPDVVTGTAGNDTINGILINNGTVAADATSTLNVSDVLDGAAGTDTLSILVAGANSSAAAPLAATLSVTKNVEVLSVKNLVTGTQNGVTVDASTATGLTQVVNNASTGAVAVTGVAANATVSVQNSKAATSVTFAADTFKAATTVANVAVNNAGTATADASIVLNDGGTVTATSLAIQADGTSYVAVTGTALAALATLTVTGSGSLDFDVTSARNGSLTKVDASALTGGLTFTAANAAKTAITGGHGNDVISIAAAMAATSTISLGDGNDAVKFATGGSVLAGAVIDGGAGVDTFDLKLVDASNINSFANFEVASLDSLATATYDLGLLAAKNTLTGLSLTAGGTNTATVSNVAAGSTLTVNGGTTTGLTLAEKGAAASTRIKPHPVAGRQVGVTGAYRRRKRAGHGRRLRHFVSQHLYRSRRQRQHCIAPGADGARVCARRHHRRRHGQPRYAPPPHPAGPAPAARQGKGGQRVHTGEYA